MGSTSLVSSRTRPRTAAIWFAGLALIGLSLLAGCEQKPQRPPVYPVSGELFVKGQPAVGALLILHPADNPDSALWPQGYPRGRVQADGKFQLESYEAGDGAPPGSYKLRAQWLTGVDGEEENPDAPPRKNQLDAIYFDPARSPWSVIVEPKPNQLPRFDVP